MPAAPKPTSPSKLPAKAALPPAVDQALRAVEAVLDQLDATLLAGDATLYETQCTQLQQALLSLQAVMSQGPGDGKLVSERLRKLGTRLTQQRDNMARRAVPIDRQVQFMLPGLAGATYSRTAGAYGPGQRMAGRFTSIKA